MDDPIKQLNKKIKTLNADIENKKRIADQARKKVNDLELKAKSILEHASKYLEDQLKEFYKICDEIDELTESVQNN